MFKKVLRKLLNRHVTKIDLPPELSDSDSASILSVLSPSDPSRRLTLLSPPRLIASLQAVKYVVDNNLPGDICECGVWRGGTSILMAQKLQALGSNKTVYMYDTFLGMTEPTQEDKHSASGKPAISTYLSSDRTTYNEWCYASLDDVTNNISSYDLSNVCRLIQGPVEETLLDPTLIPNTISILRLDTDWYASTKIELQCLYHRVTPGGVILIDDYGHWDGARKAVDEFLALLPPGQKPLLWITDHSGRGFIKPALTTDDTSH